MTVNTGEGIFKHWEHTRWNPVQVAEEAHTLSHKIITQAPPAPFVERSVIPAIAASVISQPTEQEWNQVFLVSKGLLKTVKHIVY